MTPLHVLHATKIAMNQPDTITFHGGSATVAQTRDLDPLGLTLDGARYVGPSAAPVGCKNSPEPDFG